MKLQISVSGSDSCCSEEQDKVRIDTTLPWPSRKTKVGPCSVSRGIHLRKAGISILRYRDCDTDKKKQDCVLIAQGCSNI